VSEDASTEPSLPRIRGVRIALLEDELAAMKRIQNESELRVARAYDLTAQLAGSVFRMQLWMVVLTGCVVWLFFR
jgi:hypothetical protein